MNHPMVALRGVRFRHAGARRHLFDGVDLTIHQGDRLLVAGPSGSGKSTLLALVAGHVPEWVPGSVEGEIRRATDAVAMVFQNPEAQMIAPTVEEELAFGLENHASAPEEIRSRIDEVLRRFGLERLAKRSPSTLSGGERQKVALASAIALQPRLLLLDEPTAYLDPESTNEFFALLEELPEETTIVLVEHKIDHAARFATRLLVVAEEGTLEETAPLDTVDWQAFLPWRLARLAGAPRPAQQPPANDSAPRVSTFRLSHSYAEGREALREVTLEVTNGRTVAVMGPNGAGKSTLLQKIAGALPCRKATILLDGQDSAEMKARKRFSRLLFLPQNPEHFFLRELVRDELLLSVTGERPGSEPAESERRSIEGAARFGIESLLEQNPYALSEGEKRRLNLACAFLDERQLLLLDEPTFGLDFASFESLVASLRRLKAAGAAILMVTHSPELAFLEADRLIYIEDGRVAFDGTPKDAVRPNSSFPAAYLPVWERDRCLNR